MNVLISSDLDKVLAGTDVLIDFTFPEVSLRNLEACARLGKRLVIGSTGFTPEQRARVDELAKTAPVVLAPNMSVGVNACFKLLKEAASILGDGFDVEIVELHHNKKKDSPSGTAVRMGEIVADALGRDYQPKLPSITVKACAAHAPMRKSACKPCAAATSSANTLSISSAWANASKSPTGP